MHTTPRHFVVPMHELNNVIARWRIELLVVVVLPLAIAVTLYVAGEVSLLRFLRAWIVVNTHGNGADSWYPMERAFDLMRQPGRRAYEELFFGEKLKFQYPPSSLILHEMAARLGIPLTAFGLNLVNWILVWIHALLCAILAIKMAKLRNFNGVSAFHAVMVGLLGACASLLFYPVLKAFALGQAQLWIDVAFAAACLAWLSERKFACGLLIGTICLIKPQFSIFILWAALRVENRFLAGWICIVSGGLLLSLSFFGLQNHLDYVRVLSALSNTGEAYYANQSVNGILNRLLGTAPATVFEANQFPPYHAVVHMGTLITSISFITAVLLYRRKEKANILAFQGAALAFTIASPIAWEHHYGILPPILITLYFAIGKINDLFKRRLCYVVLAVSYVFASGYIGIAHHADVGVLTLAHSYLFAAGVAVLILVFFQARQAGSYRSIVNT